MKRAECRAALNSWWLGLTYEQKKIVPTSRNKIDLHELFREAPSYLSLRQYLKEDITSIERELKQLGVLYNDEDEVIAALMHDFISGCKTNPDLLWDVELTNMVGPNSKLVAGDLDRFFGKFGLISTKYLANKLSCKVKSLNTPTLLALRQQLNLLLLKHEVSLPYSQIKDSSHSVGYDLNNRRIFLKWKNSLTDEEKLSLPMFGKVLDRKAFSDLIPTKRSATALPLLSAEYQRFSREIIELQGISYKTVKEREEKRKKRALEKEENKYLVFRSLRDTKLVSIDDFSSDKGHYEDVQHAFAIGSLKATSESGIKNYYIGYKHYCGFLESRGVPPDSSFKECFGSWSLRDFKEYLGSKIVESVMSTSYATTILSALRMTLEKLKTIRNFGFSYYPADGFEVVRESIAYKPYSPYERKQISKMLEREIAIVREKLKPYKKLDRDSIDLNDPKIQARIIFEDDCKCIPTHNGAWAAKERNVGQDKLCNFVATRRLSLPELYDEWGVLTRKVTVREVGVYVLRMAQVLGMNLNPILDLEIDDYQEHHPLTNKPCLTYWKERSTGEKMLHLDIFHADLKWLAMSQKSFVKTVFNEVIQLTSEARKYLPSPLSQRLFINFGTVPKAINESLMSSLYSELVESYQLKDDNGEPLVLTTTRFRPTLVSELIEAGVSIREVQYQLGHASIYSTMKYLEKLEFDRVIRDKARVAIADIYSNAVRGNEQCSNHQQQRRFDESQIIMKTPLGGCKNVFDPPDFIKKSAMYVKGKPCSQYNKCLSCDNVMLTENHLPELFAMQRDYLISLENSEVINTPYHVVVLENLSLLDDILDPDTSEFEGDILIQAKEDSLFIETTILDAWG
ncbi:tyrosine-type recombinase/integrase [Vibrio aestuarianus]|uniref:Tyrosine-type recombinase/integrase n=1 Tax=Vibrio aestuarianus TaxID=28171 RepID=A0AAX3U4J5_9VIBR|nr:tyrosine-type recombinase/integrase [Vibrio aestuarianus]WGK81952.1 tyrosine-type recombinase/integrase [Vibrio aestuarianus]